MCRLVFPANRTKLRQGAKRKSFDCRAKIEEKHPMPPKAGGAPKKIRKYFKSGRKVYFNPSITEQSSAKIWSMSPMPYTE